MNYYQKYGGNQMSQTKVGIKKIKEIYGKDHFKQIGKMGGNPVLIEQGKQNKQKREAQNAENS